MSARRLEDQIQFVSEAAALPLKVMALGVELIGVVSDLRALTFEIASALPRESAERLRCAKLDISWLTDLIGVDGVLIEDLPASADTNLSSQTVGLIDAFESIIAGRRSGAAAARDRITPLGWAVLAATLLQVTPPGIEMPNERPTLWKMRPDELARAQDALKPLVLFFGAQARANGQNENWPWDLFESLAAARPAEMPVLGRMAARRRAGYRGLGYLFE